MEREKKGGIIGIVITIVILIVLVIVSNAKSEQFSVVENFANAFVMPIENGLTYLKNKLTSTNPLQFHRRSSDLPRQEQMPYFRECPVALYTYGQPPEDRYSSSCS